MRILLLNSVDTIGGAAKAAQRLCKGFEEGDVAATMLVQRKNSSEVFSVGPQGFWKQWFAEIRPHLDASPVCLYPNRNRDLFSPAFLPERLRENVQNINPDLLHLHWICEGFVRLETLQSFKIPVVWTLHDSWPFTGGCHLPSDCTRYEMSCGNCPTLGSTRSFDLSRWVWKRKREVFRGMNLTLVAPSRWMAEKARSSSLFRSTPIEVIPNGLDVSIFKPHDKHSARQLLGLPLEKKIILFNAISGCYDRNKGFDLLCRALLSLEKRGYGKDYELLVLGSSIPKEKHMDYIPCRSLGRFTDDISMVLAFSAADVTVIPSFQENLPNVAMESMACGTPCVAFHVGGIPDMIIHRKNGFLASPYDPKELGEGIKWVLEGSEGISLSERGRKMIETNFSIQSVTQRYLSLYKQLLEGFNQAAR